MKITASRDASFKPISLVVVSETQAEYQKLEYMLRCVVQGFNPSIASMALALDLHKVLVGEHGDAT